MAERESAAARAGRTVKKGPKTAKKSPGKPVVAKTVSTPVRGMTKAGSKSNPAAVKKPSLAAVGPRQREAMIREAAYYRAERRGFAGGDPCEDWLEAEAEVDRSLGNTGHP